MAGTRSSARLSSQTSSSPPQVKTASNNKRKAESSPSSAKSKKERKSTEKEQKTIEQTLDGGKHGDAGQDQPKDTEMEDAQSVRDGEKPDSKEQSNAEGECL